MIEEIKDLPANVAGFRAIGEVTKEDFEQNLVPKVEELVKRTGEINYLLVLDTSIKNFTMGAWFQDAMLGLRNLMKWHKAAIITDSKGIQVFTDIFSVVIPGEFKGFSPEEYDEAVSWVSSK
ncbi:MAG: STAS/SEC14 domain-containing protein [Bacteroidota bacterium]